MSGPFKRLAEAARDTLGAAATWSGSLPVHLEHAGAVVWDGSVHIFTDGGQPEPSICYAWESEMDDGRTRTYAVLHIPPVDSPAAAVRAAIVADYRAGRER